MTISGLELSISDETMLRRSRDEEIQSLETSLLSQDEALEALVASKEAEIAGLQESLFSQDKVTGPSVDFTLRFLSLSLSFDTAGNG